MSDFIISVENLGKKYRISHQAERQRYVALRDVIAEKAKGFFKKLKTENLKSGNNVSVSASQNFSVSRTEDFWALRDVSFEVRRGEVVGIIGRNGAGKTTVLKILSRITDPTEGRVRIKGRVASLLEVGTGFHPELTGRENIFLNGAILGMHRAEIKQKFDEIVDFSEVEQFLDTPVKRYSSGMYVRLAFAVAAHLEPEILIVDEVLAVGDAAFQKKCLGKMKAVAGEGRTVLFVSHNMEAVRSLCQRGIWLKDGRLHKAGTPGEIVEAYFNSLSNKPSFANSNPAYGLVIQNVMLKNNRGEETSEFHPGEDLIVELSYDAQIRVEKPYIVLGVVGINGSCFFANMMLDGARPEVLDGAGTIACRFKSIPLLPQGYTVNMVVRPKNGIDTIMKYQEIACFRVVGDLAAYGYKGEFLEQTSRYNPVVVPYEWRLPDGKSASVSLSRPAQ